VEELDQVVGEKALAVGQRVAERPVDHVARAVRADPRLLVGAAARVAAAQEVLGGVKARVDQAGDGQLAPAVDELRVPGGEVRSDRFDAVALDADVGGERRRAVPLIHGDDGHVLDQNRHREGLGSGWGDRCMGGPSRAGGRSLAEKAPT
jgi:hypothetical protein